MTTTDNTELIALMEKVLSVYKEFGHDDSSDTVKRSKGLIQGEIKSTKSAEESRFANLLANFSHKVDHIKDATVLTLTTTLHGQMQLITEIQVNKNITVKTDGDLKKKLPYYKVTVETLYGYNGYRQKDSNKVISFNSKTSTITCHLDMFEAENDYSSNKELDANALHTLSTIYRIGHSLLQQQDLGKVPDLVSDHYNLVRLLIAYNNQNL